MRSKILELNPGSGDKILDRAGGERFTRTGQVGDGA
jgi:hypothetical protein